MFTGKENQLSPEQKRSRLAELLRQKVAQPFAAPLSFNQHRLWFLDQLDPGNPLLNISVVFSLEGSLPVESLGSVFEQIVRRHEILRTTFDCDDQGQPFQKISPDIRLVPEWIDIAELPGDSNQDKIARFAREHTRTRFDLHTGPLFRTSLVQISPIEQVAFFTSHHIVSDGWSVAVFLNELRSLFRAHSENRVGRLPELPIQFRDYCKWQRYRLQGPMLAGLQSWWHEYLDGCNPILEISGDRNRKRQSSFQGDSQPFAISRRLQSALEEVARENNSTLFAVMLAAWSAVLFRFSGQTDLLIGIPSSGRDRPETHLLIGHFVNLVAVRIQLDPEQSFDNLVAAAQKSLAGVLAHQELPFEKLVESLHIDRSLDRHPLVQTVFNFLNFPLEIPQTEGDLKIRRLDIHPGFSRFDLGLTAETTANGIACQLEYSTDLFDPATVTSMVEAWLALLQAAAVDSSQQIVELPIMSASTQQKIVFEWNETKAPYPENVCLHDLFDEQSQRSPLATAVVDAHESVSYSELARRAQSIADDLQALNLPGESPVAVLLPRGVNLIATLLGILKSGLPYLPLDLSWPVARIATILTESGARVLMADSELAQWFCGDGQISINPALVLADSMRDLSHDRSVGATPNSFPDSDPSSLAYLIFTSGSTGRPKGVMIEHRSVVNVVHSFCKTYQLGPNDRVLQQTSIAFDVSVNEIFPVLVSGGTLVIPPAEFRDDFDQLADFVQQHKISILGATPSGLSELNRRHEKLASVRLVLSGGEALSRSQVDNLLSSATVTNGYGPTETTICATCFDLAQFDHRTMQDIPIGKPLPNYRVYVLDSRLNPVPVGCPGELCIAGVGVARGYLHDPQRTAEKFVDNPFVPEERMFRSGDEVRLLADGNIRFSGRLDRQIKIRGFRVELGEIESVLASHPDVVNCAVVNRNAVTGNSQLVAYAVFSSESLFANKWREWMQARLPAYMVPRCIVRLDEMPLTANGKVDLTKLPAPDPTSIRSTEPYVAPRDAYEVTVARIWCDAMEIGDIGVNDNFFELGGHSMLSSRVVHEIKREFGFPFSLQEFFQAQTVAKVAQMLRVHAESTADRLDGPSAAHEAISQMPDELLAISQIVAASTTTGRGSAVDFHAEVQLDQQVTAKGNSNSSLVWPPRGIFLTGATGFLGAHLMSELASNWDAQLYCLVRAQNPDEANQRLAANLESYRLDSHRVMKRVVPVCGNLAAPQFGLTDSEFEKLAVKTDVIFHNGAQVNFVYPYSILKPANVGGTKSVFELAVTDHLKPVHVSSTLSVLFGDRPKYGRIDESATFDTPERIPSGYGQSKWVAERIALLAQSRGIPVSIYRPGRITGDSKHGIWSPDDLLVSMLSAVIGLGSAPDSNVELDLTPVDYVARAISSIASEPASIGSVFHLVNQNLIRWSDLIQAMVRAGFDIRLEPVDRWLEFVTLWFGEDLANQLRQFLGGPEPAVTEYDCSNACSWLAAKTVVCPPPDEKLLSICFRALSGNIVWIPVPRVESGRSQPWSPRHRAI